MALVRAISDLLAERNGVAILATHWPVVMQEASASCVALLFRAGDAVTVECPEIDTFGENLGALTREFLGTAKSLDDVLGTFNDHICTEGRALARAILRTAN